VISRCRIHHDEHEIGVARYAPSTGSGQVEFAVVVVADWQGKGIATELLRHLFSIASEVGINSIEGFILRDTMPMLRLAREFGFRIQPDKEDPSIAYAFKDIQMQAGEGLSTGASFLTLIQERQNDQTESPTRYGKRWGVHLPKMQHGCAPQSRCALPGRTLP